MVDTPRTQAYLLASEFQNGQAAGSITPQQIRDMIVSTGNYFRPETYGAKFDGSTDDTTAWTTMFAAITTLGYGEVKLPFGTTIVQGGTLKIPNYCTITGQGCFATTVKRKAGSNGILLDTSGTSDALRSTAVVIRDFSVQGNGSETGALIRWLYGSQCYTENMYLFQAVDSGLQIIATWDSTWVGCLVAWCGQGGQASSGTTIGQGAVAIFGATAASGVGSSTTNNNNLVFVALRVEVFAAEGLSIQKGFTSASNGASQIRFTDCKFEAEAGTGALLGLNNLNGSIISMSGDVRNIKFDNTYLACDQVAPGSTNIGFINMVLFYGAENILFRDTQVWIGTASQVRSVFSCFTNGYGYGNMIDHVVIDGVSGQLYGLNGGAAIVIDGGTNIPYRELSTITGSTGALVSPAYPPIDQASQTTQTIATAAGQTIAVGVSGSVVLTNTAGAALTGTILATATSPIPGQVFTVINTGAFGITFAASGTSHVFGTPVQAANVAQDYIWDGTNSLWRQKA